MTAWCTEILFMTFSISLTAWGIAGLSPSVRDKEERLTWGCSIIFNCNALCLHSSSCRENQLLPHSAERHWTWSPFPCFAFFLFLLLKSCILLSLCTVIVIVKQPLLLFMRQFFSYTQTLKSGNASSSTAAICVSHMFFFFFFAGWLLLRRDTAWCVFV